MTLRRTLAAALVSLFSPMTIAHPVGNSTQLSSISSTSLATADYLSSLPPESHNKITSLTIFSDSLSDIGNVQSLLTTLQKDLDPDLIFKPLNAHLKYSGIDKMLGYLGIKIKGVEKVEDYMFKQFVKVLNKIYPIPVYPDSYYYKGRFSNGPVFNEWLALSLGVEVENPEKYINRAYGGSWAIPFKDDIQIRWGHLEEDIKLMVDGKLIPPDLDRLIDGYFLEYPPEVNRALHPDGGQAFGFLYGANDYLNGYDDSSKVVASIMEQVERIANYLSKAPSRFPNWIYIANMPAMYRAPRLLKAPEQQRDKLKKLVESHNVLLEESYLKLKKQYEGSIHIRLVDTHRFFNDELDHGPYKYKTEACYYSGLPNLSNFLSQATPDQEGSMVNSLAEESTPVPCHNPQDYAFWDDLHPSARMHARLAWKLCEDVFQEAGANCSGVPPYEDPEAFPRTAHNP